MLRIDAVSPEKLVRFQSPWNWEPGSSKQGTADRMKKAHVGRRNEPPGSRMIEAKVANGRAIPTTSRLMKNDISGLERAGL